MTGIDTTTLRVHAHLVALGDVRPESVADVAAVMTDAATEVDRLRAENTALRGSLGDLLDACDSADPAGGYTDVPEAAERARNLMDGAT